MSGDTAENAARALSDADWGRERLMLTRWCLMATGKRSWELAEDVAQEAIAIVLDPTYADWDPAKMTITRHLANVARGILSNRRRSRASRERPTEDEALEPMLGGDGDGEDAVANRALAADVLRALQERVRGDDLAAAALRLYADGVEELEEHATALGAPKHEARNARRRLQSHAEAVRRVLAGDAS